MIDKKHMMPLEEAKKAARLFINWADGTVTNMVTLVETDLYFEIKFEGKRKMHIPWVYKYITYG